MLLAMRSLVLLCCLSLAASGARAAEWTIEIGDYYFSATNITIAPGDTVTWINYGFQQHDTTAADSSWISPLLFAEEFFTLAPGDPGYPFNSPREFPYICLTHIDDYPWQTGLIVVASANVPPGVQITSPANGAGFEAPASFTIAANASDPDGSVTSVQFFVNGTPAGTSTGPAFSANVSGLAAGSYSITATATDDKGATGNSAPVSITVTNPPVVEKFALTTSVAPVGSGTISVEPPQPPEGYNAGTMVTLTASAANGFAFSNWSGAVSSTQNPLTFTMDAAKSVTANFVPAAAPTYTLALAVNPPGSGTIQADPAPNAAGGTYVEGTVVTLTASANVNFAFTNFSGDVSSPSNRVTIAMTANRSVTANFIEAIVPTYALTVLTNPPGAGTVQISPPPNAPNGRYLEGTTVTLTAAALGTNAFTNWTGAVSSTTNRVTVVMDSDKAIAANFVPVIPPSYTLTVNVAPTNGGIVLVVPPPASNGTYTANTTVALSAEPNFGFRFVRWTGAVASSNALVLLVMTGDKTVTATFEPIPPLDFAQWNGPWAGLLIDERDTNYTTTGFVSLRVSRTGAYRGTATLGGMRSFVAGQFDRFGYAPLVVRRATLHGSLQIDAETAAMVGSLTDGRKTSALRLYRVMTPTNAELFAGQYEMILGSAPPLAEDGAASMQIFSNGAVKLSGSLADGAVFVEKSFIAGGGRIPVFVQLYGRRGALAGWLEVKESLVSGMLRWFRPGDSRSIPYPEGFSLAVPVAGARAY